MNKTYRWLAVGLLVATVGCNKGDPAGSAGGGGGGGGYGAVPAKAQTDLAPDVAMNQLFQSMSGGDAAAMWNALPAKYQADVRGVKDQFAGKVDGEVWNKAFVVVGKLGNLLKTKKKEIMASPVGQFIPPDAKDPIDKNWDTVVGVVNTLAGSEIKTIDGLKATDPGKFLSSTGTAIATASVKAARSTNPEVEGEMKNVASTKFTLVKQEGDKATLRKETPGQEPSEQEYTKVDGKWMPSKVVEDWAKEMAETKQKIDGLVITPEQKTMAMGMLAQVETAVDGLIAAKDQDAFNGQVMGVMMMAGPLMGGFGGGGGAMSGPPGGLGAPGGSPLDGPGGLPSGLGGPAIVPPTITPPVVPPVTPPKTP